MKKLKLDWTRASEKWLNKLNDLHEFRLKAYEFSAIYKEKIKKYHAQRIEKWKFVVGD